MPNKILYYPSIDAPTSDWFLRMLLYWEEISTITPEQYLDDPDLFEPLTRDLVQRGLLTTLVPSHYTGLIPNFENAFEAFLKSFHPALLAQRQHRFKSSQQKELIPVHFQKLEGLGEFIEKKRLAVRMNSWYYMERYTAAEFMAYLAFTLSRACPNDFFPMTDSEQHTRIVTSDPTIVEAQLSPLRLQVLENLFPVPNCPIRPEILAQFKAEHGLKLSSFRRMVEEKILDIASTPDQLMRDRKLSQFIENSKDDVEAISKKIRNHFRSPTNVFGRIFFGVTAKLSVTVGVLKAIKDAFTGDNELARSPLVYVAHVNVDLLVPMDFK